MGYYNGKFWYRRSRSSDGFVFLLLIVLAVWNWAKNSPQAFYNFLGISTLVVIGFFAIRSLLRKRRQNLIARGGGAANVAEINSEKHGCKCYMEHLTPGEQQIADILTRELSYKDYFIFNNLTIPSTYNGSSQIDHLVVSKFGIFVIESKDYQGWIFGSADQERWTQSLPGGKSKFQFENPIRQNWSHIKALRELLPLFPDEIFHSIVVFSDASEIKTPAIKDVVKQGELISCIRKAVQNKISDDQLHSIIGKLSYVCQTVDITPSQHIENIKARHQNGQ